MGAYATQIVGVDTQDSKQVPIACDNEGRLIVSAAASYAGMTKTAPTIYQASLAVAGALTLIMLGVYNSNLAAQFIMLFDAMTLPANGTAPFAFFVVPGQSNASFSIPVAGVPFANGMVAANSSTAPLLTVGATDCYFYGIYQS